MPAGYFIHCFVKRRTELERQLPRLAGALEDAGMIWISWPKKSSGTWSGLKLVRRLRDRKQS
jgi:hypothetical protein